MTDCLKEADRHCRSDSGGVAVLIVSSPWVLHEKPATGGAVQAVRVTEECTGCEVCVTRFECPAILWDEAAGKAGILRGACIDCGVCLEVCPMQAIVGDGEAA